MTTLLAQIQSIEDAFDTPDLSDLIMRNTETYEGEFQSQTIDTGDEIRILCVSGVYNVGTVYSYGLAYVRIIDRFGTIHRAEITADCQLIARLSYNVNMEAMTEYANKIQEEMVA